MTQGKIKLGRTSADGRENLLAAVNASVALEPVSLSFGAVPGGSGMALQGSIELTNLSGAAQTYSLQVVESQGSGVVFSVPGSAITLAAGESASVAVSMAASKGVVSGARQAVLQVQAAGAVVAHAMLYALIR